LTEGLKLEVRLLKKFLKAQGLYGAEIRVRGFSGYLTEVLTVKYGSFLNLLKGASSWRKGEVIAFEEEERVRRIHRGSWLIIADPVDPTRNLAAAISPQKVAKFILLSRSFLARPHISYFTEFKGWRDEPVYDGVVCLRFRVPAKVEDILWGELLKSAKAVAKQLRIKGFDVIKYSIACEEDEACMALLLERTEKRFLVRRGPEVFGQQDVERFLDKHKGDIMVWVDEDMRLYSFAENERGKVEDVLMEMREDPVSYGIAKGIADEFRKSLEVLRGEEVVGKEGVIGEALKSLVREGSSVKG
jgi:tRNA nucleotidyltransferase (CCA-adding enzyme)